MLKAKNRFFYIIKQLTCIILLTFFELLRVRVDENLQLKMSKVSRIVYRIR